MGNRRKRQGRRFKEKVFLKQQITTKDKPVRHATIEGLWRKSEQALIVLDHGGRQMIGFNDLERRWTCRAWQDTYDPTKDVT